MKKITGEEFCELINQNPSWCKDLKEPLEITTYSNVGYSKITHLSPLITFSGKSISGCVADFDNCKNLKVATGTFNGYVDFTESGIEKIENLLVKGVDHKGMSASFYLCEKLKVATGTFEGFVNFNDSGVTTIKDLIIEKVDTDKEKARFYHCPIEYIPKEYRGEKFLFSGEVIKKSEIKDRIKEAINKIKSETNNIEI